MKNNDIKNKTIDDIIPTISNLKTNSLAGTIACIKIEPIIAGIVEIIKDEIAIQIGRATCRERVSS